MFFYYLATDVFSTIRNDTKDEYKAGIDKLKEEYSKALSDLKAELMNAQNLKIQTLEGELHKVRDLISETNCTEVRESFAKDLNVLQSHMTAIDAKPR